MDKVLKFSRELEYINSDKVKKACQEMIKLLPDYFFEIPASSTGKYHPEYALGEGGLLRHSKAAARIGHELLEDPSIGDKYTALEKDLMIMLLMLHDGLKNGLTHEKYTRFDHPIIMKDFIISMKNELPIPEQTVEKLASLVETHMGQWINDFNGNEVLKKPVDKAQKFVHMCDYLASRKFLNVEFDANNEIID